METKNVSLLHFCLFCCLFVIGVHNANARGWRGDSSDVGSYALSVDYANWDESREQLKIKGTGEPGSTVYLYAGGTDYLLASLSIKRRGNWYYRISTPPSVPCMVRAESNGSVVEQETASAPADCMGAVILPDGSAGGGTGPATGSTDPVSTTSATDSTATGSDSTATGSDSTTSATDSTASGSGSATSPTGSAVLSWFAPTTRTDGSPLSPGEVAGFHIYHGTESGNLTLMHDLSDGSATSYTVTGLQPATHYFVVTDYDYDANESAFSAEVSKTIP